MKKLIFAFMAIALVAGSFIACQNSANASDTTEKAINLSPDKSDKDDEVKAVAVKDKGGYKVGDKASDFSLKNVDGTMVSMESFEDAKGFIITFTCNHCPYSVMYEDRLIDLHNEFAPKGYPVIAINPNDPAVQAGDSYEDMQVRAEEKKFPFSYLFDDGQKVYPKYGATRTPHVFLLDSELVVQYIGAIDNSARDADAVTKSYVKDAIKALESGDKPDPDFTKAIGCSIKVKKG